MYGCFLISDHCNVWLHSDLASAPSHPANARTAQLPHPHDHPKGHPHIHPHCHPNALQWSLGCPKTTFFWNLLIFLSRPDNVNMFHSPKHLLMQMWTTMSKMR